MKLSGISAVGYSLGEKACFFSCGENDEIVAGEGSDVVDGVNRFYKADETTTLALAVQAIEGMMMTNDCSYSNIDAMILCHTSPVNTFTYPYSFISELAEKLSLSHCFKTTITQQQCVSPLYGLKLTQALLRLHLEWRACIVCCVDKIVDEEFRKIGDFGVHSDAASALVVEQKGTLMIRAIKTTNNYRVSRDVNYDNLFVTDPCFVWVLVSLIRETIKAAGIMPCQIKTILPPQCKY